MKLKLSRSRPMSRKLSELKFIPGFKFYGIDENGKRKRCIISEDGKNIKCMSSKFETILAWQPYG